jgi:antitoxin component HigA of HigAB toxin-antitoxin module
MTAPVSVTSLPSLQSEAHYEAAMKRFGQLWGAESGTADGDELDLLATLIVTFEERHYPMDAPALNHQTVVRKRNP